MFFLYLHEYRSYAELGMLWPISPPIDSNRNPCAWQIPAHGLNVDQNLTRPFEQFEQVARVTRISNQPVADSRDFQFKGTIALFFRYSTRWIADILWLASYTFTGPFFR